MADVNPMNPAALSWSTTDLKDLDLDELLEVLEETFESWRRPPAKFRESRVAGNFSGQSGISARRLNDGVAGIRSSKTLPPAGSAACAAEHHPHASSQTGRTTYLSSTRVPAVTQVGRQAQSQVDQLDAASTSDRDLDPAIEVFLGPRRMSRSLPAYDTSQGHLTMPLHFAALDDFFLSPRMSYFPDVPGHDEPPKALPVGLPSPRPAAHVLEPNAPPPPRPETRASTIRQRGPFENGLSSATDHDAVSFVSNSSSNRTIRTTTSGSGSIGSQSYAPLAMYPRPPPSKASKSAVYPKPPPIPDVEEKRMRVPASGKTSLSLRWRKVER